jgi:hypothetical protein
MAAFPHVVKLYEGSKHLGDKRVHLNPRSARVLRKLLVRWATERNGTDDFDLSRFRIDIHSPKDQRVISTFTVDEDGDDLLTVL